MANLSNLERAKSRAKTKRDEIEKKQQEKERLERAQAAQDRQREKVKAAQAKKKSSSKTKDTEFTTPKKSASVVERRSDGTSYVYGTQAPNFSKRWDSLTQRGRQQQTALKASKDAREFEQRYRAARADRLSAEEPEMSAYQDYISAAKRLQNSQDYSPSMDDALQMLRNQTSGIYNAIAQSGLSNEKNKAGSKLVWEKGEQNSPLIGHEKERTTTPVSFASDIIAGIDQSLSNQKVKNQMTRQGEKSYFGLDEYQKAQEMGPEKYAQTVLENNDKAQSLIDEWNQLNVEYGALREQLGAYYNMPEDPNDPMSYALRGTNSRALEVETRVNEIAQELETLGYDLDENDDWTRVGAAAADEIQNKLIEDTHFEDERVGSAYADAVRYEPAQNVSGDNNPTWEEVYSKKGAILKNPIDETKIENKATFARDNALNVRANLDDDNLLKRMTEMTADEVSTYTKILEIYGVDAADAYARSIRRELSQRSGERLADAVNDSGAVQKLLMNTWLGAAQSMQGLNRAMGGDTAKSAAEVAQEKIYENIAQTGPVVNLPGVGEVRLGDIAANLTANLGGMLPSMVSGPLGPAATGLYSGGNTYAEALESGDFEATEAYRKALLSGTLEAGLEKALGLAATGGGVLPQKLLNIKGGISNPVISRLANVAGEMLSEGSEEYLQEVLDPITDKIAKGEKITWEDFDWSNPEAIYAGYMGAALGAPVSAGSNISSAMDSASVGRAIQSGEAGLSVDEIINEGLNAEQGTKARRMAERLQNKENIGSTELGDLFYAAAEIEPGGSGKQEEAQEHGQEEAPEEAQGIDAEEQAAIEAAQEEEARIEEALRNQEIIDAEDAEQAQDIDLAIEEATEAVPQENASQADFEDLERSQRLELLQQVERQQADQENAQEIDAEEAERISSMDTAQQAQMQRAAQENAEQIDAEDQDRLYSLALSKAQSEMEETAKRASGLNREAASAYAAGYTQQTTPEIYDKAFRALYDAGKSGLSYEQVSQSAPVYIEQMGSQAAKLAYNTGRIEFQNETEARQQVERASMNAVAKEEAAAPEFTTPQNRTKGLNREYSQSIKMDKGQEAQLRALDAIGKKYGLTIALVDQVNDGKSNGSYNAETGVIEIAADALEGAYMYVATHEMVHHVQNYSADEYQILKDFVVERLQAQADYDIDARIQQYMQANQVDEDGAIDEIVADAIPAILSDETNVRDFVSTNRTLATRIRDFFADLVKSIQNTIDRLARYHGRYEIDALRKDAQSLTSIQDMFTAALDVASFNRETAQQAQTVSASNFNADNQKTNIRYSMKELGNSGNVAQDRTTDGEIAQESINLISNLAEKAHETINQMSSDTVRKIARNEAKKILSDYNSKYSFETLAENLEMLYGSVAGVMDWNDTVQVASDLGKAVIEQSSKIDPYIYEKYSDLRKMLRETRIRLTESQKEEIQSVYGSVNDWRKKYMGKLLITDDGTPLDLVYHKLSEQYPEIFYFETAEEEMPFSISEAIDSIQPIIKNPFGMDQNGAALDAGMTMISDFFNSAIQESKNSALQSATKTAQLQLKNKIEEIRQKYKNEYNERLKAAKKENILKLQSIAEKYKNSSKNEKARLRDMYKKLADRKNAALDRQKAYYQEMRKNERVRRLERGTASKYRTRIEQSAKDISAWLERPTDKLHVPEFFKEQVAKALEAFDFSGKKGRTTQKGINWSERVKTLSQLMGEIERARTGEDQTLISKYRDIQIEIDPDLVYNLESIARSLEGKSYAVADLNSQQLKVLSDALTNLKHGINAMNKTFSNQRYKNAQALGDATVEQLEQRSSKKSHTKAVAMLDDFMNVAQLDAYRFFRRLGDASETIVDSLSRGKETAYGRVRDAQSYIDDVKKDLNIKRTTMQAWAKGRKTFELESGQKITMNPLQVMELYNLWNRPQAAEHILKGGIRLSNLEGRGGVKFKQERVRVTQGDVQTIISSLSDTQRNFAKSMQKYLADTVSAWGNETSMQLYGYEKFGESTYWPIQTDKNFLRTRGEDTPSLINGFTNAGFTKALTPMANNPILVGDAMQTFSDHVGKMANYNGLAAPMEDALRWYNFVRRETDEKGNVTGYETSTKEQISRVLGDEGKRYIESLFKDLNGQAGGQMGVDPGNWLLSAYKKNAIAAKLRVVIQQPTSIFRAGLVMEPKYMIAGLKAIPKLKNSIEEMHSKSGIAWWKSQGHFEIGMGKSMRDMVFGDATTAEAISNAAMSPAGIADDLTWGVIWEGTKAQVKAQNPELKVGSNEYWNAVNTLFSKVVNDTQVVDSVLHRSQLMKKKGLAQLATSFMSEPTKQFNMFQDAVRRVYNKESGAKKYLVRTVIAATSSIIANQAALAVFDAITKRGEDDEISEEIKKNFIADPMEWANNFISIPYFDSVFELLQGYDVERADMAIVSDLIKAFQEVKKLMDGESKKTPYQVYSTLIKSASAFTAFPFNGIITSIEQAANAIWPGSLTWTSHGVNETYSKMLEYIKEGNADKSQELRERLKTTVSNVDGSDYTKFGFSVKSDKEIDAGVAKLLAMGDEENNIEADARIAQAWEAREKADTKTVDKLKEQFIKEGFTGEMFDRALQYYDAAQNAEDEEETKDLNEQLNAKLYSGKNLVVAIKDAAVNGDMSSVTRIADEIMADSTAKDPTASIKSIISDGQDGIKPEYIEAYRAGNDAQVERLRKVLINTGWYDEDDLNGWIETEIKGDMWTAFENRDIDAAKASAHELVENNLVKDKNSLLSSINTKYGPIYKDLYFSGDKEGAQELSAFLQALGLKNNKGEAAYSNSWIKRYWRSNSARKKWEEENKK